MTTLSSQRNPAAIKADWWSKSIGGTILGFTLALALAGLFAWFGPGGLTASNKFQFNMWLVPPIWLLTVSLCFLFQSGRHCWLWLGSANVLAYSLLFIGRSLLR